MTFKDKDFRSFPIAWTFHQNTNRWAHNAMTSSDQDETPEPGKENPELPFTELPEPRRISTGFHDLLDLRCSCRDFARSAIPLGDLGALLHYAMGVWGRDYWGATEFLERSIPSGGGMYPLELYVLVRSAEGLAAGVYHYVPLLQGVECVREVQIPKPLLSYLFMGQYPVTCAAAVIIIAADVRRCMKKYDDRGYRYMLLEAGHAAQNLNLAAVGLDLQSLNLGGFLDDELAQLCGLDRDREIVLYAVAIGRGASTSKHALRFSD